MTVNKAFKFNNNLISAKFSTSQLSQKDWECTIALNTIHGLPLIHYSYGYRLADLTEKKYIYFFTSILEIHFIARTKQ